MEIKDKVINLFSYIKELCSLKYKVVTDISNQLWSCFLDDIPDDPENIFLFYRDRIDEYPDGNDTLLRVQKPEFEVCPSPPESIQKWILPGWEQFSNAVHICSGEESDNGTLENIVKFEESKERTQQYEEWQKKRTIWCEKQRRIDRTRKFFSKLYQNYIDLERDSENFELVAGNGVFTTLKGSEQISHPIITKRLTMNFNAAENVIFIKDSENDSEIYTMLLQEISGLNLVALKDLKVDLQEKCYHPFDRKDTPEFLKILIHKLSSDSVFIDGSQHENRVFDEKMVLAVRPVFFIRKRIDGTLKAIETIIDTINANGYVPAPLRDIVGGGKIDIPELNENTAIEASLAAISGEDTDILLSKEANREQLEIAQRIENYNAVLVQGPPGTGKTHTIANLLGHFLAQGKSVLVTSHTKKALAVLKDKIPDGIRDLCVTVLDDTNTDMERSVDGITDYISRYTSSELKNKSDVAQRSRIELINKLASARKRIYSIKFREFSSIVYNGASISPTEAAKFVYSRAKDLSYIPGNVKLYHPLPISLSDLNVLYRSNGVITNDVEQELALGLPNPDTLLSVLDFEKVVGRIKVLESEFQKQSSALCGDFAFDYDNKSLQVYYPDGKSVILAENIDLTVLNELSQLLSSFDPKEGWMVQVAACGVKGKNARQSYEALTCTITETANYADEIVSDMLGVYIHIAETADFNVVEETTNKMRKLFLKKGKIGWLDLSINKLFKTVLEQVSINGNPMSSTKDCDLILKYLTLRKKRHQLSAYWNELMASYGMPQFCELGIEPEAVCLNIAPKIIHYMDWLSQDFEKVLALTICAGLNPKAIFIHTELDSEYTRTEKKMIAIQELLPIHINIAKCFSEMYVIKERLGEIQRILLAEKLCQSTICLSLSEAVAEIDVKKYEVNFRKLSEAYEKYSLLSKRTEALEHIKLIAPDWAESIRCRKGLHGLSVVPENVEDAWKWKQYAGIIAEIVEEPFTEMQKQAILLSKELRSKTAIMSKYTAWYHLLKRTESNLDLRQALQGWKKTVKKIGKGTGKNAPMLKKEARKLMEKCQIAVPAWIMPVSNALESFNPSSNQFDIIIIDEASQSDITSLAIVYMAKKIIVVGDDEQVSPMAVGVNIEKINALSTMYIREIIPNWQLYGATSSLYDIAGTTFQPLMLREHFRCVPEIIGYSNRLSYDFKIKPLREEAFSLLRPSVVNFRVANGIRAYPYKVNEEEARHIVALIMACIEKDEYAGMTFGVISLLGDEQAAKIQMLMLEKLSPLEIEKRRIVCGNASHFQGDERNVIFLSMVDSNDGDGPLRMTGEGVEQSVKQRYNVAVSRAKDQLWIIHSLDYEKDLKQNDIRRELLEYAENPKAFCSVAKEITQKSNSPFEDDVAKSLVTAGYHITQQWEVGAYRIDMVAEFRGKTVAIECDGELYHSGDEEIRSDMECQTILERLGWQFVRIRGSEYYQNPAKSMERIIADLNLQGIYPETTDLMQHDVSYSDLFECIKTRATQILNDWKMLNEGIGLNANTYSPKKENSVLPKQIKSEKSVEPILSASSPSTPKKRTATDKKIRNIPVQMSDDVAISSATSTKISQENAFVKALNDANLEYIDRRAQSGFIFIVHSVEIQTQVEQILAHFSFKFVFEKRGVMATNNNPAWRVVIG